VSPRDNQWRQLGSVLVEAGLLTESQLASALEDQQRTGRKLGEIIVDRGFVSSAAIANALAEQHGRVLKTEYGFGTGLRSLIDRRRRSETPDVPASEPAPAPPLRVAPQPTGDPPPLLRGPSQRPPDPAEPKPQLVVEPPPDPVPLPEPSPEPVPEPLPDPVPEPSPEPVPEPQREVRRIEELVHALTQRDVVVEELREQLESQAVELGTARARLADLERELAGLKRASAPTPPPAIVEQRPLPQRAPEPDPAPRGNGNGGNGEATSYLLCVPNATGFMLLERAGAVPSVGTEMGLAEEPEGRYRVTKVVRSVSSPTARPTAYLRRV
jgi:hypothetical protein